MINIGELSELRHSLDNVNYLLSLYNDPDSRESMKDRTLLNSIGEYPSKKTDNIDRERALLKIYREGLNLSVICSVFDETTELKHRFGTHQSKVVFHTLHPNFENEHEYHIKMDTMIFEHLKYRQAVFEIRHYFVKDSKTYLDLGKED